ncbi:hypothetical protein QQ045_014644 [Rhodiola kirilowii]
MDPSSEVPKFRNRQEDPNDANSTCLEKAGLKQTTSDQEGQISMDLVKLESPLSPLALDIVSQKITARLKPENHGQSSGKVESFVTPRSKHGRGLSLEENDLHRPFHSSLPDNSLRSGATTRSPHPGGTPRRTQRHNTDNDYSFEHSPATPHHGKVGGKGRLPASPFWERKVSSSTTQGFGFATPGRHQPKPVTYGAESVIRVRIQYCMPYYCSPITPLLFLNLEIGMKATLLRLTDSLRFLTKCENKGKMVVEQGQPQRMDRLLRTDSRNSGTVLRVAAAFLGASLDMCVLSLKLLAEPFY